MRLPLPLTALAVSTLAAAATPALAAATATVTDGVLTITGDGGDDRIGVALAPGSPGMLRVEALDTLVNGEQFADFAGVRSITVNLGDGADVLAIGTLGPVRLALSGVTVVHGTGSADISILSVTVKGEVRVDSGDGPDTITFSDLVVSGPLTVDSDPAASAGAIDVIGVTNCQVSGDVTVRTGGGNDSVTLASLTTSPGAPVRMKRALVELGDGDDSLSGSNFEAATSLVVHGGAGNDTLAVLYLPTSGTPAPRVKSLELDFGEGATNVGFVGSNSSTGTVVGTLLVRGGGGDDTMIVNETRNDKGLTLDTGGGNDRLLMTRGVMKKAVVAQLGEGDDQITTTEVTYGGSLSVDAGGGNDTATLNGAPRYKTVPVFTGFEVSDGEASRIAVRAADDELDRLVLDVVLHRFEVFVDDVSVAAGPVLAKVRGASASVKNAEATDFPFTAKVSMNRTGKGFVRDLTGAVVLVIDDRDPAF